MLLAIMVCLIVGATSKYLSYMLTAAGSVFGGARRQSVSAERVGRACRRRSVSAEAPLIFDMKK